MLEVRKEFLKKMAALASKRKATDWTVPPGLVFIWRLHARLTHFAGNKNENPTSLEKCRYIQILKFSDEWRD